MSDSIPVLSAPASAQRWRRAFSGELVRGRAARRLTSMLLDGCPLLDTKSGRPGGTFTVEITLGRRGRRRR